MNADTGQQPHSNDVLDLGTRVWIDLRKLACNEGRTIDQLIAALEMTASLTNLVVDFENYVPTPENNRRIVEPLCRCLSNLRCRNERHPLRDLALRSADHRIHGMSDVFDQFVIAATKYGGIYHLSLVVVDFLPVQFLVDFCRNNNNLQGLDIHIVTFSDGRTALSVPPNQTQDSSVMLALDKLVLKKVSFRNSTAVNAFADFIARLTVRALELGDICSINNDETTSRILSEIKIPSSKQLRLRGCQIEHFNAALEAGTTSLIKLVVHIFYDENDYTKRLELLAHFMLRTVQLNSLTIHTYFLRNQPSPPGRELLRAIESCATLATVARIQDDGQRCFSRDEVQQLRGIAARNEELAGFVASPSTYPTENLLGLMRQFDNCPTGRYTLARNLPAVFSFEKIKSTDSLTTEPHSKKRKIL